MPRSAATTRDALLAAGRRLFATDGVYSTPLSRIVTAAGQRNTSALHYHFATDGRDARTGLLFAIIDEENRHIEDRRRVMLDELAAAGDDHDLRSLVVAYVAPQADRLDSVVGRQFLSIVSQLVDLFDRWDEVGDRTPAEAMRTFRAIEEVLSTRLSPAVRRERIARFLEMVSESLGARARRIERSDQLRIDNEDFVDNLVDMTVGALSAEPSAR